MSTPKRAVIVGAGPSGFYAADQLLGAGFEVDLLDAVQAELYFGFADQDQSMNAEQIAALERALDEAGATYVSEVYGGAGHGYTMADTPVYDEAASERHFRELRSLLERTVGK